MTAKIQVSDIVMEYEVFSRPRDIAAQILLGKQTGEKKRVLDKISFDAGSGEVIGIIGINGAGKSTLLKIITGVLQPTSGSVKVNGRVTAILELGLGFNADLSGRENIELSGLLYGMDAKEIEAKKDSIIAFSELGDMIDQPVKTYSSGMHARLAFSIATASDPDILIIDEALATGDSIFVQKSMKRIRELCSGGRTVLLVSHGTGLLAQLCQKVIWLENGKIRNYGPALEIVQQYDLAAHEAADAAGWVEEFVDETPETDGAPSGAEEEEGATDVASDPEEVQEEADQASEDKDENELFQDLLAHQKASPKRIAFKKGPVFIKNVSLISNGQKCQVLKILDPFTIAIDYTCEGPAPKESFGIALAINALPSLDPVFSWNSHMLRPYENAADYDAAPFRPKVEKAGRVLLEYGKCPLRQGRYVLSIGVLPNIPGAWSFWEYRHFSYEFRVSDGGFDQGAPLFLEPHYSIDTVVKS